jgi:hypothetical protein
MGWLRDSTRTYTAGLWAIAACLAIGATLVFVDARTSSNNQQQGELADEPA